MPDGTRSDLLLLRDAIVPQLSRMRVAAAITCATGSRRDVRTSGALRNGTEPPKAFF
jgi:hypothetical protein